MKINEIINEDLTSMNLSGKFYVDEDELKKYRKNVAPCVPLGYDKARKAYLVNRRDLTWDDKKLKWSKPHKGVYNLLSKKWICSPMKNYKPTHC